MGVDYSQAVKIGFLFSIEDIDEKFAVTVPEQFHMEERFDPKTGVKITPVKIIDRRETKIYRVPGRSLGFESGQDLMEHIAHIIGASLWCFKDYMCGGWEWFVIGPPGPGLGTDEVDCRRSADPSHLELDEVLKAMPGLNRIGSELAKYELNTSIKIVNGYSVS